ncbi:FxSxx-COOH system tetratricopeptide repeat protein [Microbispora sp. CA-135349]|uniref:FxSxx-COOH system tetratricopeptide repeat protein n=1 Tax=Microbispora sp. CA-135349 TaxID=3239953 RepID=UPI003D927E51
MSSAQVLWTTIASLVAGVFAFLTAAGGGYAALTRRPATPGAAIGAGTRRVWGRVPPRNPGFTNRDHDLGLIRTALAGRPDARSVRSCALHGLGGVGKSSLMSEYAHRYGDGYRLVWWVRAEQQASLAGDLARLLGILIGDAEYDGTDVFSRLTQELRQWEPWLIMFDNAPDVGSLRESWPEVGDGHILVTSRSSQWEELADETFCVEVLSQDHAVALLRRRVAAADTRSASEVAERLGCLPLALVQAASYVSQTSTTLAHYADLIERRTGAVFAATPPSDYNATIATTWSMSIDQAAALAPGARALLAFCSFMAPEAIPRDLPGDPATIGCRHHLRELAADQIAYDLAVAALNRYSLLTADTRYLSMHRLVQLTVRASLDETERRAWAETTVKTLNAAFPGTPRDRSCWGRCAELMPHALSAAEHARAAGVGEPTGELLLRAGVYLAKRSFLTSSLEVLRSALEHLENTRGHESVDVAETCGELARVQHRRADLADALLFCQRAVKIKEKRLGPASTDLTDDLVRLSTTLMELSRLQEAEDTLNRALSLVEQSAGPESRPLVPLLGRLSYLRRRQGRFGSALSYAQRQLEVESALPDPDQATIADAHYRIGDALVLIGDFAAALDHHLAAYEIFLRLHGQGAFDVLKTEQLLSDCYLELADPRRAVELARAAVDGLATLHGFDHPDKAAALRSLGTALVVRGRAKEAEGHLRASSAIYERFYGEDHPYVAEALVPLALAEIRQGRLQHAEQTLRRAEDIVTVRYAADHPAMAPVLRALATLHRARTEPADAGELEARAEAILEVARHS